MSQAASHPVYRDLQNSFQNYATRIAIIDKDGTPCTYAEFETYILGAYQNLLEKGIKKGSKVLVAVPMSMELYAILEALFAHGAIAVFLDPWMKGKKMGSVIRQVAPDLFIVTKKLSRITWLLPATWRLNKWKVNGAKKARNSHLKLADIYDSIDISNEDNALITFTSGTSGAPKGANRTFGFLFAQAETLKAHLGSSENASVDYTNFPIVGLANFALGNTVAIPQLNLMKLHESDPAEILNQLHQQKVSRLIVSPSLLRKVFEKINAKHTLKTVMTGGAPISISLVHTALKKCPSVHFEAIYGSTEAEPICITTFEEINTRLAQPLKGVYVGKPVEEIELKIISFKDGPINSTTFDTLLLKDNQIGEVVVTGNHVNKNYYENPAAFIKNKIVDTSETIWHRTGDLGYLDNGVLYLVGRDHRIIERNGEKYYPYPLEQYLELAFGLNDIGYIQQADGKICLHYFSKLNPAMNELKKAIAHCNYPVDQIIKSEKPLPRDARHKSKLQIEGLQRI